MRFMLMLIRHGIIGAPSLNGAQRDEKARGGEKRGQWRKVHSTRPTAHTQAQRDYGRLVRHHLQERDQPGECDQLEVEQDGRVQ
jgi:hypothetical protein